MPAQLNTSQVRDLMGLQPYLQMNTPSSMPKSYSAFGEIIGRYFHIHPVIHHDLDLVLLDLATGIGQHYVIVLQFDSVHLSGQYF